MYDLIYGGAKYRDELQKIFPESKIADASDEIHQDRVSIELEIEDKEYWKRITLNGFLEQSLNVTLVTMSPTLSKEFREEFEKWKISNPEAFK